MPSWLTVPISPASPREWSIESTRLSHRLKSHAGAAEKPGMPDSSTGIVRSKLTVLAGAAAAVVAVVGLLPMAGAGAQQAGICTGCPVPTTTAPPPLAPTTTVAATPAGPNVAAPKSAPTTAPVRLVASLGPGQVVPRPKSSAAGSRARFVAIVSADVLTWALATDGTPAGVARVRHGAPGSVGPVVVNLGPLDAAGAGTVVLTDAQEESLRNRRLYIEVVTPRNPRGEVRGEIR